MHYTGCAVHFALYTVFIYVCMDVTHSSILITIKQGA